jgi:hypothetical protein
MGKKQHLAKWLTLFVISFLTTECIAEQYFASNTKELRHVSEFIERYANPSKSQKIMLEALKTPGKKVNAKGILTHLLTMT